MKAALCVRRIPDLPEGDDKMEIKPIETGFTHDLKPHAGQTTAEEAGNHAGQRTAEKTGTHAGQTMADEAYTSHNTNRLDVEGTVKKILTTDYVNEALEAWKQGR